MRFGSQNSSAPDAQRHHLHLFVTVRLTQLASSPTVQSFASRQFGKPKGPSIVCLLAVLHSICSAQHWVHPAAVARWLTLAPVCKSSCAHSGRAQCVVPCRKARMSCASQVVQQMSANRRNGKLPAESHQAGTKWLGKERYRRVGKLARCNLQLQFELARNLPYPAVSASSWCSRAPAQDPPLLLPKPVLRLSPFPRSTENLWLQLALY